MPSKTSGRRVFSFELLLWGVFTFLVSFVVLKLWTNRIHELEKYFPRTTISEARVVGFAQYNGYPLFSDTFFMLVYAVLPLVVVCFTWVLRGLVKKIMGSKYPRLVLTLSTPKITQLLFLKEINTAQFLKFGPHLFFLVTSSYFLWIWSKLPPLSLLASLGSLATWVALSIWNNKQKSPLGWFAFWCYWLALLTVNTILYRLIPLPYWYLTVGVIIVVYGFWFFKKSNGNLVSKILTKWQFAPVWLSLSTGYFSRYISDGCFKNIAIGFDSQNFLTWDYTAALGLLPYRDIFYLYGYFLYFRFNLLSVQVLYFLAIALFVACTFIFAKYWIRSWVGWVLATIATVFVLSSNMYFVVGRYGWATFGVLALAIVIQRWGKHSLTWVISGAVISLLFAMIHDQGGYLGAALVVLTIANGARNFWYELFQTTKKQNVLKLFLQVATKTLIHGLLIGLGIILGLLPLIWYLQATGSTSGFIEFLGQLGYMNLYAKTPFMNFVLTPGNYFLLLTQGVLALTLGWNIFFLPHKLKHSTFLGAVGILVVLTFFQVKNYLRPTIDQQLIFTAIMGWVVVIGAWRWWLTDLFEKRVVQFGLALFFGLITWRWHVLPRTTQWIQPVAAHFIQDFPGQVVSHVYQSDVQYCLNTTFKPDNIILQPSYTKVWKELSENGSKNPRVFSFPADPVFYFLFNQNPSFIFNIYDGSAESSQQRVIRDLELQQPEFIIFNTSVLSIQDGVPDIIRANTLWNWMTSHYKATKKIDEFIVFEPGKEAFLTNPILNETPALKDLLYHVPFQKIACLEGSKVTPELLSGADLLTNSLGELNTKLSQTQEFNSHWLITKLEPSQTMRTELFFTQNGLESSVKMGECTESEYLAIHVTRLPALNQIPLSSYQVTSQELSENKWWLIQDTRGVTLW